MKKLFGCLALVVVVVLCGGSVIFVMWSRDTTSKISSLEAGLTDPALLARADVKVIINSNPVTDPAQAEALRAQAEKDRAQAELDRQRKIGKDGEATFIFWASPLGRALANVLSTVGLVLVVIVLFLLAVFSLGRKRTI